MVFKFAWFRYFFIGFMVIALSTAVIGVNITFWQQYTIDTATAEYTLDWYSIKRLDTSFWYTFKTLSRMYEVEIGIGLPKLPNVPLIPTFNTGGWFLVLDLLISVVNGLSSLINFIINIMNSLRTIIVTTSAFINALAIWVANAGAGAVPIIY